MEGGCTAVPWNAWYYTRMLSWLKQSLNRFGRPAVTEPSPAPGPLVIPRDRHTISRANISGNALKVLHRLSKAGYEAYLVGGGVRDLLLGREPKDFDIATDADPEEVRHLFRNCRLIGRRFRLAHVHFGPEIIEVATFRGSGAGDGEEAAGGDTSENGMLLRDNIYGTLEEDAWRRDFTVNALYYDIRDFSVVDHTGGMADLEAGRLSIIGEPGQRFREDPVRMLRAVRFAAKLGFRIDEASEAAIHELGHLLREVPSARLFDESLKLFLAGYAVETFELLRHYRLFEHLFPETEEALSHEEGNFPLVFVARALENTDRRIDEGKPVTPAFLFAALLWEPVRREAAMLREAEGMTPIQALQLAGDRIVARQVSRVAFPRRFSLQAREIWALQERLQQRSGKRPSRLLEHPRFRAGYDFLELRAGAGEESQELATWWREFQSADENARKSMAAGAPSDGRRRRSRRGGGRRRSKRPAGSPAE